MAVVPIKGMPPSKCGYGNYSMESSNKGTISVSIVIGEKIIRTMQSFTITSADGVWQVQMPSDGVGFQLGLIENDYVNYAVVYGCTIVGGGIKLETSAVMSRMPTLNSNFLNAGVSALQKQSLPAQLQPVIQANCPNHM